MQDNITLTVRFSYHYQSNFQATLRLLKEGQQKGKQKCPFLLECENGQILFHLPSGNPLRF